MIHDMSELKQKSLKGVKWTTTSAVLNGAGGLIQILFLARMMDPGVFALISIINIIIGFSTQLIDMGFSNAILRKAAVSKIELNTLYWLNLACGVLFATLFALTAPLFAAFFSNLPFETLKNLIYATCPIFVISAASMQYQSLLQRDLQFKLLAIIEIASLYAGLATIVVLTYEGWGAYAIVAGTLCKTLTGALLLIMRGVRSHIPGFQVSGANLAPIIRFGVFQSLEKTVAYIAVNFDTIMIAKFLSPAVSGVYELVKRLLLQPWYVINPLVTKVTYPVMASVNQDTARLKNIAMRAIQLVGALNIPIYAACAIGAGIMVPVVFGEPWHSGIEPFVWLALTYMIRAVLNPLGSVILAKGRGGLAFLTQAIAFTGFLIAVTIGAIYGLRHMLITMLLFNTLLIIPIQLLVIGPLLRGTLLDVWRQVNIELLAAFGAFGTAFLLTMSLQNGWLKLFLFMIPGGALYLCALFRFRAFLLNDLKQMFKSP